MPQQEGMPGAAREKLDSAVAAVMALDRAVRNGGSVYDERGILSF